jgi:oxalate decarboxylase
MSAVTSIPEPIVDGRGGTILGPRNVAVEREHPSSLIAPETDAGASPVAPIGGSAW